MRAPCDKVASPSGSDAQAGTLTAPYRTAGNRELWRSDGTGRGTQLVKDIIQGDSAPSYLSAFGDQLLFSADDGVHGEEPWITNGEPEGTRLVEDVVPGARGSFPFYFTSLGSLAVFEANPDAPRELWRTDGTEAGTEPVDPTGAGPGVSGSGGGPVRLGDFLLFPGYGDGAGTELWRTDATATGTFRVEDIFPGPESSYPFSQALFPDG